jgi:hypothetical protein
MGTKLSLLKLSVVFWYSPGSTLKKKKGQTSDQCGVHHYVIGGLAYATPQGLGPTVSQSGLLSLAVDPPWQHACQLHLYDAEWQTAHFPL